MSGEAVSSGAHKPPSSWEREMDGERLSGQEIDGESQWEGSRKQGGMETMNRGSLVGSGGSGELWGVRGRGGGGVRPRVSPLNKSHADSNAESARPHTTRDEHMCRGSLANKPRGLLTEPLRWLGTAGSTW